MSLAAHELAFSYPRGGLVISGVDLAVAPGERVAVEGPSGAGKTTLCRLLAGFLVPTSGTIEVDGVPLVPVGRLRGPSPVQLLWQHPEQAFDPRLPLGRSLAEGVRGAGDKALLADLMDALGAHAGWLDRLPHELSGGELTRLAAVRALAARPSYLIADEATAMLDAVTQAAVWHALMALQERDGWGMVVVSHSPSLLDRVATRRFALGAR